LRNVLRTIPALLLFGGLSHYALADTDWKLDVKFSDGAVARGTFITNDAGTVLESWKIHVKKGLDVHDFVSKSKNGISTSDDFGEVTTFSNPISWPQGTVEALEFADFGTGEYSVFYLGNLLTGDPISIIGALDCGGGSTCGTFVKGSIVDPPLPSVPEPVSIILLGSAVVAISFAIRRRSGKRAA
jgi:hypothetical protein